MESEEYYDSLDEGSEYDESRHCPDSENENVSMPYFSSSNDEKEETIPFYEASLSLSQIDLSKQSSKCSGFLSQNRSISKSRMKMSIAPKPKPKKSYLEMFYERTGQKMELGDCNNSSRPTGSSSSPKSFTTCEDDDDCDKVTTCDLKSEFDLRSEKKDSPQLSPVPPLKLGMDGCNKNHKFNSNSEQFLNKQNNATPRHLITWANSKLITINTITMASKATDTKLEKFDQTSKLEVWKRRQEYGQRASERNRIKMQEEKALINLEKEMKNSTNKLCI